MPNPQLSHPSSLNASHGHSSSFYLSQSTPGKSNSLTQNSSTHPYSSIPPAYLSASPCSSSIPFSPSLQFPEPSHTYIPSSYVDETTTPHGISVSNNLYPMYPYNQVPHLSSPTPPSSVAAASSTNSPLSNAANIKAGLERLFPNEKSRKVFLDKTPNVFLCGLSRCGKTSISKVVFHKTSPHETLYIPTTQMPVVMKITNTNFFHYCIVDIPGSILLDTQYDEILFPYAQSIVYIIDAQNEPYNVEIAHAKNIFKRIYDINSNVNIEVFIHKIDGDFFAVDEVRAECQRDIHDKLIGHLHEERVHADVIFYSTSIYDHTIFEACSRVLQRLIPQVPTVELLLDVLVTNCRMEKAFLIDVLSKTFLATDSSPFDPFSYELCTDMIEVVVEVSSIYGGGVENEEDVDEGERRVGESRVRGVNNLAIGEERDAIGIGGGGEGGSRIGRSGGGVLTKNRVTEEEFNRFGNGRSRRGDYSFSNSIENGEYDEDGRENIRVGTVRKDKRGIDLEKKLQGGVEENGGNAMSLSFNSKRNTSNVLLNSNNRSNNSITNNAALAKQNMHSSSSSSQNCNNSINNNSEQKIQNDKMTTSSSASGAPYTTVSLIQLNTGHILYVYELDRLLALACVTRDEYFDRQHLIDFNIKIFCNALLNLFNISNEKRKLLHIPFSAVSTSNTTTTNTVDNSNNTQHDDDDDQISYKF